MQKHVTTGGADRIIDEHIIVGAKNHGIRGTPTVGGDRNDTYVMSGTHVDHGTKTRGGDCSSGEHIVSSGHLDHGTVIAEDERATYTYVHVISSDQLEPGTNGVAGDCGIDVHVISGVQCEDMGRPCQRVGYSDITGTEAGTCRAHCYVGPN